MPTEGALLRVLDGRFFPTDIPGVAKGVPVSGIHGYALDSHHAAANQVVAEGLARDGIDDAIEAVISFFSGRGSAFEWLVHDQREPRGLASRLAARGFSLTARFSGMVLELPHPTIPTPADVATRRIERAQARRHVGILERGFGLPPDAVRALTTYRSSLPPAYRVTSYLATLEGRPEPIAYGESVHAPGTSIVLLGGAATESPYRGRGAYRSLLDRRLADAYAAGAVEAVILAERSTSAPICARAGFREIAALASWTWTPDAVAHMAG